MCGKGTVAIRLVERAWSDVDTNECARLGSPSMAWTLFSGLAAQMNEMADLAILSPSWRSRHRGFSVLQGKRQPVN